MASRIGGSDSDSYSNSLFLWMTPRESKKQFNSLWFIRRFASTPMLHGVTIANFSSYFDCSPARLLQVVGMKKWLRRFFWFLAVLTILVFLALWLVVPPLTRYLVKTKVSAAIGREASVEKVRLNPFGLQAEIEHLKIAGDGTNAPWLDIGKVNFDPAVWDSIVNRRLIVESAVIQNPHITVIRQPDGGINFAQLGPASKTATTDSAIATESDPSESSVSNSAQKTKPAELPDIEVRELALRTAHISWRDDVVGLTRVLDPVDLNLGHFRTTATNPVSLKVASNDEASFDVDGNLYLQPLHLALDFDLNALPIQSYAPYLGLVLNPGVSGDIQLTGQVHVVANDSNSVALAIKDGSFQLHHLEVDADPPVSWSNLTLQGIDVDLLGHTVSVDSVGSVGLAASLVQMTNGVVNFSQWLKGEKKVAEMTNAAVSHATTDANPSQTSNAPAKVQEHKDHVSTNDPPHKPWVVSINNLALEGNQFRYEDQNLKANIPVSFSIRGQSIGNAPGQISQLNLDATVGENQGDASIKVKARADTGTGEANIKLNDLALLLAQPWLTPHSSVEVTSGLAGLEAQMNFENMTGSNGMANLTAHVGLSDWQIQREGNPLLAWNNIEIRKVNFAYPSMYWSLDGIDLNGLKAHLGRDPQGVFNLTQAFAAPKTTGSNPVSATTNSVSTGAANLATNQAESVITSAPNAVVSTEPLSNRTAQATNELSASTNAAANVNGKPPDFQITIGSIRLQDCLVTYRDETSDPALETQLDTLNASVTNFAWGRTSAFDIALTGNIQYGAPLEITGSYDAAISPIYPKMKATLKNVYLAPATGMSAKYIAREIDGGALSVRYDMAVQPKKLNGELKFLFDHIQVGEEVASPDAVDIPLGLALFALSKKGLVDETIPIEGDPTDPSFKLGKVIMGAILNIVTKVASVPIDVAVDVVEGVVDAVNPFGGDKEVPVIDFADGSAELSQAARDILDEQAKAMKEEEKKDLRLAPLGKQEPMIYEGLQAKRLLAIRAYLVQQHGFSPVRVLGMPPGHLDPKKDQESNPNQFVYKLERLDPKNIIPLPLP